MKLVGDMVPIQIIVAQEPMKSWFAKLDQSCSLADIQLLLDFASLPLIDSDKSMVLACVRWIKCGSHVIVPADVNSAAARMLTSINPAIPIKPPWPVFALQIPGGLLDGIQTILVLFTNDTEDDGTETPLVYYAAFGNDVYTSAGVLWDDFMKREERGSPWEKPDGTTDPAGPEYDRQDLLIRRYIINTCLEIEMAPTRLREASDKRSVFDKSPRIRKHVLAVARDLAKIQYIDAVRDFTLHGRSHPTVRFMVRGLKRKLTWIHPHWKGPVDGDIQSHEHRMVEK